MTEALPDGADINPQAGVIAQYVKDLSFENPNAPRVLQQQNAQEPPQMQVAVNVAARKLGDDVFEVDLKIEATAKQGADTVFVVELLYAGLFGLRNIPEESLEPFLIVTAPTLMFPFARRIIADVTRDGGFMPLLLDPIDFGALYLQRQEQANGEGAVGHA